MRLKSKLVALCVFITFLYGCTASHTVEKTEFYARKMGVINQFEISRWHSRGIPSDSRIYVAVNEVKAVKGGSLSSVVAHGLSPYFIHVASADKQYSMAAANSLARKNKCNFLLHIELIKGKSASLFGDDEQLDDSSVYKQMHLLLSVVDVVSGTIVDKIKLSSNTAHFNFLGSDMSSLLAKPLTTIGQDLTGV